MTSSHYLMYPKISAKSIIMVKQKTIKKINNPKMINNSNNNLATLVYTKAIEERVKSKYLKRIDYLVEANNELIAELEQYERVSMTEKV
jgi:hypothetical protein